MSELPAVDACVVGAGLAGLAAAWDLRAHRVIVLESEDRVGGRLRSEERAPYWLNLGAGVFSAGPSPVRTLIEEMGLHTVAIPGSTTAISMGGRLLKSGPIETYPLRLPISSAARLSLVKAGIRIRLAVAKYHRLAHRQIGESEAEVEARLHRFEGDRSFADFLGRVHPDVDAILRATAAQRIGAESETIAASGALGAFVYQWSGEKSLLNHNLVGGSGRLPQELAARLTDQILTDARVTAVEPDPAGVTITFIRAGERQTLRAKAAIVATPADVTRSVVQSLPHPVADALGEVRYGPAVLAAMLTDEVVPMPYDDVYAAITPKSRSTVFINVASSLRGPSPRKPGGSVLLYRGGDAARELLAASDMQIEREMLAAFGEAFPGGPKVVGEIKVQRWPRIVPFAHPGRYRIQQDLERDLGRVILAGDYLGSWANMESAVSSGKRAAAKVTTLLSG